MFYVFPHINIFHAKSSDISSFSAVEFPLGLCLSGMGVSLAFPFWNLQIFVKEHFITEVNKPWGIIEFHVAITNITASVSPGAPLAISANLSQRYKQCRPQHPVCYIYNA